MFTPITFENLKAAGIAVREKKEGLELMSRYDLQDGAYLGICVVDSGEMLYLLSMWQHADGVIHQSRISLPHIKYVEELEELSRVLLGRDIREQTVPSYEGTYEVLGDYDKRFLVFSYLGPLSACGGMGDFEGSFDTVEEAMRWLKENPDDCFDIYDRVMGVRLDIDWKHIHELKV